MHPDSLTAAVQDCMRASFSLCRSIVKKNSVYWGNKNFGTKRKKKDRFLQDSSSHSTYTSLTKKSRVCSVCDRLKASDGARRRPIYQMDPSNFQSSCNDMYTVFFFLSFKRHDKFYVAQWRLLFFSLMIDLPQCRLGELTIVVRLSLRLETHTYQPTGRLVSTYEHSYL